MEHLARVENVEGQAVDVVMTVDGACRSCAARKVCGMDEGRERRISVRTPLAGEFSPGEQVVVGVERQAGVQAVAVAYVYPFALMLAALLLLFHFGAGELAAGLSALAVLPLYYLVVRLFRGKVEKRFVFKIHKA